MHSTATVLRIDGPKLRTLRLGKFLTIAELAEMTEMDPSHIASVERGEVESSRVSTIRRLARALEVDPGELVSPLSPDDRRREEG